MNRQVLEKPFPPEFIKNRKGNFGNELSYVEGSRYVERLNEAFEGEWSWTILGHEERAGEVVVHGVLEAGGVKKAAFGGSLITTNKHTGEIVSVADDLKAAATDALKKACSLLGIGLDLYRSDLPVRQRPARAPLRAVPEKREYGSGSDRQRPAGDRLTAKQLRAIYAIAHANGITDGELRDRCLEAFGVTPQYLAKADASAFIDELGKE